MFNPTILTAKVSTCRLPVSSLLATLLYLSVMPSAQAANTHQTDSHYPSSHQANNVMAVTTNNLTTSCSNDIAASTSRSKPRSSQRRAIDCMFTQLKAYQQNKLSARQQYFAYKAQAWLNYAYNEDSIKSESIAGKQAFQAGTTILQALREGDDERLSVTTDIPTSSALMRPDLWATLTALKDSDGISAAPRELAFSEVALIWAAANQCEHGRRQSGDRFRMADRWLEQAREAYVNAHDSATNVALENLINDYYKQYAPLDSVEDKCRGQMMPLSINHLYSQNNTNETVAKSIAIPMPVPTATYRLIY